MFSAVKLSQRRNKTCLCFPSSNFQSQKTAVAPLPIFRCQLQVPACHLYFWPTGCKSWLPWSPPWVQWFARMTQRTQGNIFTSLLWKQYEKQMNIRMKEMHGARYMGRDVALPCSFWAIHSPSTSACSPVWKLPEPLILVFLWRLYHIGIIDH